MQELPGHDQSDREPTVGRAHADTSRVPMEKRGHDATLGRGILPRHRDKFPQDHGLERSLAVASDPGTRNSTHPTGGRVR